MHHLSHTLIFSAAMLGMVAVPLGAADMQVSDLRLGVGLLSRDYRGASSMTITDGGNNVSYESSGEDGRDADTNWRGQLQYVRGYLGDGGGLIWGLGVAVNHARWDDGPQTAHVTTPVGNVLLGYGYAFTPQWHIELTGLGGYGRAYYSVSDADSSHTSDDWDTYIEYGGKLGTYFAPGNGLVVGIEVCYLVGRFEPDYDYNDGTDSVTVSDERRNRGFGILATVGMRF